MSNVIKKKILIIKANFYPKITDLLLQGAIDKLNASDYEYETAEVMGIFEVPAAIAFASATYNYVGYIALGCAIRGQTSHYDYVCVESARGLNDLAMNKMLAIGYGIITAENEEQALVRADKDQKDKGGFAALACMTMIDLKERFQIGSK
jgi:6,7-dimethyl-8-ribityllumazine synthase